MTTVRVGKKVFAILFPDLLRPLTESERTALKKEIKARGVIVPIVVDEDGGIIDGINRATLAAEVGLVGIPTVVRRDMSLQQKRDLALALNDARRHLTPADRKKVKEQRKDRVAEKRGQGKTLEAIAQEEGVSHVQIINDLKDVEKEQAVCNDLQTAPTPPPAPERVTGKDGKSYPARKPRKEKVPQVVPAEPPVAPAESEELRQLKHWWSLASESDRLGFLAWQSQP